MVLSELLYYFFRRKAMIFIVLLSVCLSVNAENGYGYEVQVEPLRDAPEADFPLHGTPTGGYTYLGFGEKKAPKQTSDPPAALDKGSAPEMRLSLNTVASESSGSQHAIDVVLVLDSSYSITLNGWIKQKEAAKKLIDGLDISPEGTHVSIMKFSTDVAAYYMFDPRATKEKLKQLLDDLQYDGEWSRMDLAMQSVDRHVFTTLGGARLGNVPKEVVIFSDGKADGPTPPEEEIDWKQQVAEALNSLRKKNVGILGVAVGMPDKAALEAIAGGPDRVFDVDSVDNLVAAVEGESLKIPPTETPAPSSSSSAAVSSSATATTVLKTSTSALTTVAVQGTCTAIQTVTLTTAVPTTPVTTVIMTETQTNLITATETAMTLTVKDTQTNTVTETVTATATQSLTSTAMDTATSTVTATATATEVVTLTTTVGVTSTTYAKATATPIPITIMGSVQGKKKRNRVPRIKRWYENYLPTFVHRWMAIKE